MIFVLFISWGKFNIRSYFNIATSQYECYALCIRHYVYSEFQKHVYDVQQYGQCTYDVILRRVRETAVVAGK